MTSWITATDVARVVPNPGAEKELLEEVRPRVLAEFAANYDGRVESTLIVLDSGEWLDIWYWDDLEKAQAALQRVFEISPSFARWSELVDMKSLEWGVPHQD